MARRRGSLPQQVGVAISPSRILAHDPIAGTVTYTWKTNAEPDITRTATISAVAFLHRFGQHILPPRFHRIRFRGLWSTAHRAEKLHVVQAALNGQAATPPSPPPLPTPVVKDDLCPHCGIGHYHRDPDFRLRPTRTERRRTLARIRIEARSVTPVRATIPA